MFLTGLARVARDAGITVREVPGWQTRTAHKGGMNKVHGVIWHHTATPAASVKSRNNPTLNYMVNGLGYPLANYGLAWDGSLDVIAAGTGAHAGKGSYKGIPNNDGNRHLIGVEVEGTIGLTWSDAQLETAARLGAQLDREFGKPLLHIGHYEWGPGRKTDPTGIPGRMPALRAAIKRGSWSATIKPASPDNASRPSITTPEPEPTSEPEPTTPNFQEEDMLFIWGRTRGRILSGGVFAGVPFSLIEMARAAKVPVVSLTDEAHASLSKTFADRTQKVALDEEKDG